MKCAIMQPTYLPWSGYFNLMAQVDKFVFLDDVQFERRSWQSRNRVLLNSKEHLLTVPVIKAPRGNKISEILIDNSQGWRDKHGSILRQAYNKTQYGPGILEMLGEILGRMHEYLVDLNIDIIEAINRNLGLNTSCYRASKLSCTGNRSEHLAAICNALDCSTYVSPRGSHDYLVEDDFTGYSGLHLVFQDYQPRPYPQKGASTFVSHLSIIDVVAHGGWKLARSYITGNQRIEY